MIRTGRSIVAIAVILGLTWSMAACGSRGAGSNAESPTSASAEDAPSPDSDEVQNGDLAFGEAGSFEVEFSGGENYPLEVAVAAPVPFTPSPTAKPSRTLDQQAAGIDEAWNATNVYFDLTITNTSSTEVASQPVFIPETSVRGTGDDDHALTISDNGYAYLNCPCDAQYLQPGESITLRQGWTVQSAESIEFVVTYRVLKTGFNESLAWSH